MSSKETRRNIIRAGQKAVKELIKVLSRIDEEKNMLEDKPAETKENSFKGFAEGRSR